MTLSQQLPADYEEKLATFWSYCKSKISEKSIQPHCIINMDEVPLTFDMPLTQTVEQTGTSTVPIRTTGNEKTSFTVVLGILSDGQKLPPMAGIIPGLTSNAIESTETDVSEDEDTGDVGSGLLDAPMAQLLISDTEDEEFKGFMKDEAADEVAGSRKQKGQRWAEGHTESLKSEVHVQQKKRSASEETIEDFEGDAQDQGKRSCLSIPVPLSQNTSGFPLETTMRDMEGSGKTGTKIPGSSLEKNDRQLLSKWSKRVGQISSKDNRIEETENKEQITGSTSRQAHGGRISQYFSAQKGSLEPDANLDCNTEISDSARSADASEGSKQMQHKRTPCMYGSGCYRKNPIHFQQFSHPNDDEYYDMAMVAKDDNDNRPECPYGTACYRKNPQHKLEYKHSAAPGKRAVEKDSVNDDEANDSFIDDDEEDEEDEPTDEDSDWEPSSEEKDNGDAETPVKKTRGVFLVLFRNLVLDEQQSMSISGIPLELKVPSIASFT
ncbi:aprataxin and PNKP like factor [Turdus rufiventris]|nr:aprataxin and PNKP like factor [Turdus rufiventris]